MEIKRTVDDNRIEWVFHGTMRQGKPVEPYTENIFEEEPALALMLINDVVFLNSNWFEETWPKDAQERISINVNCNDVFAWGCADAEPLPYDQIEALYKMWRKDPAWGSAVWCIQRRGEMPQKPVEDRIRKAGIWDLDALMVKPNETDAAVSASFACFAMDEQALDAEYGKRALHE